MSYHKRTSQSAAVEYQDWNESHHKQIGAISPSISSRRMRPAAPMNPQIKVSSSADSKSKSSFRYFPADSNQDHSQSRRGTRYEERHSKEGSRTRVLTPQGRADAKKVRQRGACQSCRERHVKVKHCPWAYYLYIADARIQCVHALQEDAADQQTLSPETTGQVDLYTESLDDKMNLGLPFRDASFQVSPFYDDPFPSRPPPQPSYYDSYLSRRPQEWHP